MTAAEDGGSAMLAEIAMRQAVSRNPTRPRAKSPARFVRKPLTERKRYCLPSNGRAFNLDQGEAAFRLRAAR
jgi:hypothetical protein